MKMINTDNKTCDACGVTLDSPQAPDVNGFVFCSDSCRALEKEMFADFKAHSEYVKNVAQDPFNTRPSQGPDE